MTSDHPGQIPGTTRSNDGYAWSGAANVTRGYSSNGLDQLTVSGATALGYDTRGNLTSSGSNAYTYSAENLLLADPGSAALTYDPCRGYTRPAPPALQPRGPRMTARA